MKYAVSRRHFLRVATAGLAGPWLIPARALGRDGVAAPSDRLTMGFIGVGGMGTEDLKNFLGQPDVQALAVCDVDRNRRLAAKHLVDSAYGSGDCAHYNDFREVLARDDIDAVMIATPDHWHALIAIAAAKAGKDLYCEKPISRTVAEGRAVVEAMERYGTVYQSGTQRRSIGCFRFAVEVARSGLIGQIHTIHTQLGEGVWRPQVSPEPVPDGFDYDMWLGPAPYAPYTTQRCHGSFRWISDYSGGQLTDIGAHFNDLAQWGNDSEWSGPFYYEGEAVFPRVGLFDTPIQYQVRATYIGGVKLIMHDTSPRAVRFEGDEGWVSVDDYGNVQASPSSLLRNKHIIHETYANWQGHHRDFLNCVRTRRQPIAPPEAAHRSSTICHIANICLRLGCPLKWDLTAEQFVYNPDANRMLTRTMRAPWHL